MEDNPVCPACHVPIRATDYFCYNCGKNLHPKPLSTSFGTLIILVIKSIFLCPLGIIWGIRYLRQSDIKSKVVGVVTIAGTIILLILISQYTINLVNTVNEQVDKQLRSIQGF